MIPQQGAIEVDGADLRTLDIESWRSRLTAVFQDFVRFELPLRDNVAPAGVSDQVIEQALAQAAQGAWPSWARALRNTSHGIICPDSSFRERRRKLRHLFIERPP